jgi:hypothetical protein
MHTAQIKNCCITNQKYKIGGSLDKVEEGITKLKRRNEKTIKR